MIQKMFLILSKICKKKQAFNNHTILAKVCYKCSWIVGCQKKIFDMSDCSQNIFSSCPSFMRSVFIEIDGSPKLDLDHLSNKGEKMADNNSDRGIN